jgi:hypothetical protein
MKICVAGWYYHKPFLETIQNSKYESFLVAHRDFFGFLGGPSKREKLTIPSAPVVNVGLEFGCYDWYLKNEWKSGDVLFMHDDLEITEKALMIIANLNRDQVFLFSSEDEARANGYAHGRAMYCSEKFLTKLKEDGGFWYDEGNTGQIPPTTADSPNHHNAGILTFRAYLQTLPKEYSVNRFAFIPGLKCGYRGRI